MAATWALCRMHPGHYRSRLLALAAKSGIRRPGFVLSFDCDTDRDSAVVLSLHERLRGAGLHPLYAVAGEVLQSATDTYRSLARDGAEFLNHGYRRHAAIDAGSGDRISTYFYDAARRGEWQDDIRLGHSAVADVAGRTPDGFRTPHFGSFDGWPELNQLWHLLAGMGYRYSSSTRPVFAAAYGPVYRTAGIAEFPVSGCLDRPAQILDSWGLIAGGGHDSAGILSQLDAYLALMRQGLPLLLNMYLDPVDIAGRDDVIAALGRFAPYEVAGGFTALVGAEPDRAAS